jgi:RHS repeat-associated protein
VPPTYYRELSVTNNFRFPGQFYDSETGYHYNYHRYYDPRTGRYLTPDPIGLAGGINPYVYVQNDPVNFSDPFGLTDYNFLPPDSDERRNADLVKSPPNTFVVAIHATPWGFIGADGKEMTADELTMLIVAHDNYRAGMTVRLDACESALSPFRGLPPPARQVADALNDPRSVVLAPNNNIWYDQYGNIVIAPSAPGLPRRPDWNNQGYYIPFRPQTGGGR